MLLLDMHRKLLHFDLIEQRLTSNVQCVCLAAGRCTQAATPLTNGTINETLRHTLDISQGSVATSDTPKVWWDLY